MERTLKLSFELLRYRRRQSLVNKILNITSKDFATCSSSRSKTLGPEIFRPGTTNLSAPVPQKGGTELRIFGSKENKGVGEPVRPVFAPATANLEDKSQIEPPTNCCMSGCPNCVWIDYAEALTESFSTSNKGKERLMEELNEISDENIKAYIKMELRVRGLL